MFSIAVKSFTKLSRTAYNFYGFLWSSNRLFVALSLIFSFRFRHGVFKFHGILYKHRTI
jgi:hypothetical protein